MRRRHEHGEVGLAAGAGKGARHVGFFSVGRLDAEDEHVLGQPALLLGQEGADAQGETFLAQQNVAAVVGGGGDDGVVLREMGDVAVLGIQVQHAMQAAVEILARTQMLISHLPHARHDSHAQHHIDGVRQLDADFVERRAGRPHQVGNDIERAAAHGAGAEAFELAVHFRRRHPIIGRPRLLGGFRAEKRAVLAARHIQRIGAVIIAAGQLLAG